MQVKDIKLAEIATSPLNPRKTFDEGAIKELAQSIEQNGLIQAITLRKKKGENGEKYEIVCGECRYRAHVLLGRETIEAVVKELDDKQAFACMVIENLQRKDIDPMEEASALKYLYSEAKVSVKEIAKMLGKSGSFVEKAREFDPFGHAGLTPSGIIRLTPSGKIKMTPVDDTAGEFFCSFENPCPGTAGFNVKYYKI